MDVDLFGEPIRQPEDPAARMLREHDAESFDDRVRRLRYVMEVYPSDYEFLMSMESHLAFDQARTTFVNGDHVAVLLLAQAFAEHRLQGDLINLGEEKVARSGMTRILKYVKRHALLHPHLIARSERLRNIRNPFTHSRPEDPNRIDQRMFEARTHHFELLEHDARDALSLMYALSITKLRGTS